MSVLNRVIHKDGKRNEDLTLLVEGMKMTFQAQGTVCEVQVQWRVFMVNYWCLHVPATQNLGVPREEQGHIIHC